MPCPVLFWRYSDRSKANEFRFWELFGHADMLRNDGGIRYSGQLNDKETGTSRCRVRFVTSPDCQCK